MKTLAFSTPHVTVYQGDALAVLRTLPDESVDCCVTSPPYWGLRDYGVAGQLGLEKTPDEYVERMVEVFREVRRVLRDHGTLWLNLGDSYASDVKGSGGGASGSGLGVRADGTMSLTAAGVERAVSRQHMTPKRVQHGLKPKDMVGIPWRVAFALQQPYYTGTIKREADRIWLAAMIDAEGCIFLHKRKTGQSNGQGYERKHDSYSSGMEVSNTSKAIIDRIQSIVGRGSVFAHDKDRKQRLYRWNLRSNECRDVLREVYPYLVAKQQQARIAIGCPSSGDKAEAAHAALMGLHNGIETTVDFPAPETMYEPGFYLRSDVIWSKLNPMPESVTDRPTKSHEYIFLLSKSSTYFFDQEAVREPMESSPSDVRKMIERRERIGGLTKDLIAPLNKASALTNIGQKRSVGDPSAGRNIRSVWTIATQPYPEAHFATFPEELPRRAILAGCPEQVCATCGKARERLVDVGYDAKGRTTNGPRSVERKHLEYGTAGFDQRLEKRVTTTGWTDCGHNAYVPGVTLDPFAGSGTTLAIARDLGRRSIGIELSPEYVRLIEHRCAQLALDVTA